ncbi:hypothetical protein [Lysinibacillus fusiformis]|uniref:hypothetical protein n=1 Tax=Lysinibacillus fusiformis TaxID=28031 RepID=UPI0035BFC64C|nr:hypothetical protein QYY55_23365 [Lysinibacillus fusiformis]
MVKYYYEKYTAIPIYQYSDTSPFSYNGDENVNYKNLYKRYSFDKNTNTYSHSDPFNGGESMGVGGTGFFAWGSRLERYQSKWDVGSVEASILATKSTKDASNNQKSVVSYNKGALQESGIIAEDGTYPLNGYHSDGFWYVRGGVANTAPTQPGPFTQPSGTLEIGDSKVFAVGAASDAESNLSKYIWEASINGGAYSKVGETTTNSLTYTIPTATSLKMRVKAVDTGGLESAYRESSQYTVTKPMYYWSKYTVSKYNYYTEGAWASEGNQNGGINFPNTFKNYAFNSSTGVFNGSGGQWGTGAPVGSVGYSVSGLSLYKYTIISDSNFRIESKFPSLQSQDGPGSLITNGIQDIYDKYTHSAKNPDGFWYVRGSRVNQSIAPPTPFTSPSEGKKFKPSEVANIAFGASNAANLSLYEVDYRYNAAGAWTPLAYNNTLTRSLTITTDKTLKTIELRVRAKDTNNVYSDYVYSETFEIEHNVAPTVSLTGPGDNSTLYENDTLNISGTAYDPDLDQAVTVYYQINAEPRKVLTTNLSKVQIALSKQLTFKAGKIYDGEIVLTDTLAAGIEHKLKVWAVDSENATSKVVERTFFVVPNRAPLLSIDAVVPSGVVDVDKFKIGGTALDEDANSTVKVTRKINSGDPVEIYSGQSGAWEFDVSLAELAVGDNTIVIEVIDNYGAKASKTIKLKKNEVKTPILHAVARYKITPPAGSAKGVLLFIERDEEMDLKVELSMTLAGEQEQYETLTADNTAPMPNINGIVEDTYYHEATEPKDNIILKLSTTRPDAAVNHKIHLISGAIE